AADTLCCQDGSARAAECVEHYVATTGTILHGIRHERNWFDRRMAPQLVQTSGTKRVGACVMPDIGARAAVAAELDVIGMGRHADPVHSDEFVGAAVQRALTGVGLCPDRQVQHLIIYCAAGLEQFADMAPIHAHEMDRTISRDRSDRRQALLEELDKTSA